MVLNKSNLIYGFLIATLIIIGSYLRFDNLGKINYQNDEFFHVTTAKGYLETGTYVMWDFLENKPTGDYVRAFPYTWLVAQSFNFFGVNEFTGRLPSLVFGILSLPLIYYIAYKITGNKLIALLSLLLIAFDNSFIWSSRICRMYSMFIFLAVLSSYLLYRGLNGKNDKFNYYYLLPGSALFIFSYLIHEATLAFGLGFIVYFLFNFKEKRYKILSIISLSALLLFFGINFFIKPLTTNAFFVIRLHPNFSYFSYPFNQLRLGAITGWLIMFLGLLIGEKKERIKIFYLCQFIPILLFFIFIGERYEAKKYILFIIPFILIIFIESLYILFKKYINHKKFIYFFVVIFLLCGPIFSWPGINKNFFFQLARADENYQNAQLHNFKQAYQYIESSYQDHEPVIIQGKQGYYFTLHDLNFISMKANKEFTLENLQNTIQQNKSGWVIWPKYKADFHVRDSIVKYCQDNLKFVEELKDTNMVVYRWD